MPYKDKQKQKEAMRQILKSYRRKRQLAMQFILEKDLQKEFAEYTKAKDGDVGE